MSIVTRLAGLYEWANQPHQAITYLERLLAAYPDESRYVQSLMSAYQSLKMTDKAREMGLKLLAVTPDNPDLLRQMAYIYMDTGDPPKAYEMLLRYKNLREPDNEIVQNLAWTAYTVGDIPASIGYYEQLLEEYGNDITWIRELGRLYIETGQTAKAQELIERYTHLFAGDMQLQILLADIYIDKKQYDQAVELMIPLIEKVDAQTKLLMLRHLADLYIAQEEYGKAIEYLAVLNIELPDDTAIVEQLAYAYIALDQPEQALHYLNILLESSPDDIQAHYTAGYLNRQLHRDRQARDHFVHAISALKRHPQNGDDAPMYARLYHQLRHYEHAMYWYSMALNKSPDDVGLWAEYLGMLLELEMHEHIIAIVENASAPVADNQSVRHYLALAYAGVEKYDDAIEIMEQLIAKNPASGDYPADLAYIFQKKGRWDKSIQLYDDLIKRQSPSWARYAEIEGERKSLSKQYAPKLTTGFLLIDEIKKDTRLYYANFQMYLMYNLLVKTGVSRYYFHDASLASIPNVDDDLTEANLEIEYFIDRHWSVAIGPLVINNSTKDVYTFSMGLLYNNFDDLSFSVRYSLRDKVIDPRVAIPLGGTSNHVNMKVEWQAVPYLKLMAEGVHGDYHFLTAVRRMELSTSPGYYNQMIAGADLSLLYDPHIALTYRYYWSDSHIDRNYDPLFNIATKNRSHQFGIRLEHQVSNNISVYGTGFVAHDDERDMYLSRMGQYGIEFGMRCNVTENIELGGSYTFFSEKGIDAQPGRASYVNIFSSIAF